MKKTLMTSRKDNTAALDAFLAKKAEIDTMIARLQALSAEHFEVGPDEVNWGHVGTLGFSPSSAIRLSLCFCFYFG